MKYGPLRKNLPGQTLAHVLGRFYMKQVDVLITDIERGPELIVSSKTMMTHRSSHPNQAGSRVYTCFETMTAEWRPETSSLIGS